MLYTHLQMDSESVMNWAVLSLAFGFTRQILCFTLCCKYELPHCTSWKKFASCPSQTCVKFEKGNLTMAARLAMICRELKSCADMRSIFRRNMAPKFVGLISAQARQSSAPCLLSLWPRTQSWQRLRDRQLSDCLARPLWDLMTLSAVSDWISQNAICLSG